MRRAEPLEPEVVAALEAIDATLHEEPVDRDFADLAELSLILRDQRPEPDDAFISRLDRQVSTRFAFQTPKRHRRRKSSRRGLWAGGSMLAGVVAIVLVLVIAHPHLGGSSNSSGGVALISVHPTVSGTATTAASAASGATSAAGAASSVAPESRKTPAPALPVGPAPVPHVGAHREVAQSARLTLTAAPGRIERVSQQLFDVIGSEHAFVASSHVDAERLGTSTARFSLRVPSGRLQQTLNRLSRLRHARVIARSDASQDVTGRVNRANGDLAQAQALHRSLVRQLAAAQTTTDVDRIQTQLRQVNAAIVRDQDALQGLHRKVIDSTIRVSIQSPMAVVQHPRHSAGGGFTLRGALHDAGRVLVVAAGVALIALSVLVPAGLLAAFAAWLWALSRHRRRESTLGP